MKKINKKQVESVKGGIVGILTMPIASAVIEAAKQQEEKKSETSDGGNG